jgi:phage-related protein
MPAKSTSQTCVFIWLDGHPETRTKPINERSRQNKLTRIHTNTHTHSHSHSHTYKHTGTPHTLWRPWDKIHRASEIWQARPAETRVFCRFFSPLFLQHTWPDTIRPKPTWRSRSEPRIQCDSITLYPWDKLVGASTPREIRKQSRGSGAYSARSRQRVEVAD